jgi:hypothetical protein
MSECEPEWKKVGEDIDGEKAGESSGFSVSLSGDGNTVAIGSPNYSGDNGNFCGRVEVFMAE